MTTARITADGFTFVGNALQPSLYLAEFTSTQTTPETESTFTAHFKLPLPPDAIEYEFQQCLTISSVDNFAKFKITVVDSTPLGLGTQIFTPLGTNHILGKFRYVCTVIPPRTLIPPNSSAWSEITIGSEVYTHTTPGFTIRPDHRDSMARFGFYITDKPHLFYPSTLNLFDINPTVNESVFYVDTPPRDEASSMSYMLFYTPNNAAIECDAFWDLKRKPNSAVVVPLNNNKTLKITLSQPVNKARHLRLDCHYVYGEIIADEAPSGLASVIPTPLRFHNAVTGPVYSIADTDTRREYFQRYYY